MARNEVKIIVKNKIIKSKKNKTKGILKNKTVEKPKLDISLDKRIMAVLVDDIILFAPLITLGVYIETTKDISTPTINITWLIAVALFVILFFFALFSPLLKDVIGRSLGKKIFKLKIISTKGNLKPTIWQLILRNVIFLGLFDLIFILCVWPDGYRVGDKLAKTRVVSENYTDF